MRTHKEGQNNPFFNFYFLPPKTGLGGKKTGFGGKKTGLGGKKTGLGGKKRVIKCSFSARCTHLLIYFKYIQISSKIFVIIFQRKTPFLRAFSLNNPKRNKTKKISLFFSYPPSRKAEI